MLTIGNQAPGIELSDLNGETHLLDGLTLLLFIKTSCPTCQYAWPLYERLYQAYHAAGLNVLGISQHDTERTAKFAAQYGSAIPLLIDRGFVASREYDPDFVPTGFLIDGDKLIVSTFAGWTRGQYQALGEDIAARLGVKPRALTSPGEEVVAFKAG